jgi:hypothetical protein
VRRGRIRRSSFQGGMRVMAVKVGFEIEQLVFEIGTRPENLGSKRFGGQN